jgi:AsmA protein
LWRAAAGYSALGLVCLGLAAAAFLVVAAPVDLLRDRLIEQVKARTGRDVAVVGATSLSLFPSVTVSLADVSLAAPPDMPGAPVLTVPVLEAEVGYWQLVAGRAAPRRITLHRPIIELAIDADGRRSWEMAQSSSGPAEPGSKGHDAGVRGGDGVVPVRRTDIGFGKINIVDGTVRYSNARASERYELTGLSLVATADEATGVLRVEGSTELRGERMALSGTAAPLRMLAAGKPIQLAVKLSGRLLEVNYEGTLATAGGLVLEGGIGFTSPSGAALQAWLSKGSVNPTDTGRLAGSGKLSVGETRATLSDLDAVLGETSIKGALDVEMAAGRPRVGGKLAISDLDMGALLVRPAKRSSAGDAAPTPPQAMPPPQRNETAARGWRDDPINLALLRAADVDITLSVGRLLYKDIKAGPGALAVEVKDGVASIKLDGIELYGGRARGTLMLDGTADVPVAGANLTLTGVSMPPLSGDTLGFQWLDGRGNVALEVAGQGLTERQIVESLNGRLSVAIADGAMIGADAGKIVTNLQQGRLASLAPAPGDRTTFSELAGTFEIVNGTATSRDLRLVSPHVKLDGEGTFALGERQMRCELRAKISGGKRGEAAALNVGTLQVPITISGSWERPTYGIKGQEQLMDSVRQIGKRLKSRDVQDTIKGLLGSDKEERARSREKARELLEKYLKKE